MKSLAIALSLLFVATNVWAKPKAYIDVEDHFFSGAPTVYVDGKDYDIGFFGYSGLEEAMQSDSQAAQLASSYKSYATCSSIAGIIGVVGIVLALTADRNNNDELDSEFWTPYWAGVSGLIVGGVCNVRAQQKLARAVNQYNGVYDQETAGIEWAPATNGLGLSIRF